MSDEFSVIKAIELKIATSGYSDRWLSSVVTFTAKVTTDINTANHRYDNREDLFEGLQQILRWEPKKKEEYITLIREHTTTKSFMSGKTNRTSYCTLSISEQDIKSINAFLLNSILNDQLYLAHSHLFRYLWYSQKEGIKLERWASQSYRNEHITKSREQLKKHPLNNDLQAIVKYQLSECDRTNIETTGHCFGVEYGENDKFRLMPAKELPLYVDHQFKYESSRIIFEKRLKGEHE